MASQKGQILGIFTVILLMLVPLFSYFLLRIERFSPLKMISFTAIILCLSYGLLRIAGIHITGEEGDYVLIVFIYIFVCISSFQFLRLNHKWAGKLLFTVSISPLIMVFPFLIFLLMVFIKSLLSWTVNAKELNCIEKIRCERLFHKFLY